MAFCKYCGKEIPDGTSCNCPESLAAEGVASAENAASTTVNKLNDKLSQVLGNENVSAVLGGDNKKQLPVLIGGAVAVIVVLCLLCSALSGGYKKPVKQFVKGFNSNNTLKMMKAMYPKDYIEDLKDKLDDRDIDWDDYLDDANDDLEDAKEDFSDDVGDLKKLKVKFISKKKVSNSVFDELEEYYDDYYDAELKKAYKVKVQFTFKGTDGKDKDKGSFYVVKLKGEGWKISMYDSAIISALS